MSNIPSCITPVINDPSWTPQNGPKKVFGYCFLCGSGVNPDFCPQNGEWTHTSLGCGSCYGADPGDQCEGNGVVGQGMGCVRLAYNADPKACCVNQTDTIGSLTCDPKFRQATNSDCFPYMKQHCDNSTNFFSTECQAWLKNIAPTQKGTADQLGNKYCPGSDDPFCACYNIVMPSDVKDSAKGIFRCLDSSCKGNQQALNTIDCPTAYVDCSISDVDVVLNQSTAQKITIANDCSATGRAPAPTPSPSPTPSPTPSPSPSASSNVVYALLGFGVLLLVIIIVLLIVSLSKKKPSTIKKA